jgi:hypothetical protein
MRNHLLVIGIIILFFISALIPMSLGHDKIPKVKQQIPINFSSGNSPEEEWNKTYGGNRYDYGHSGRQTSDGGYILTGNTWSYGAGGSDVWLIKTDANGNEIWNRTFGGTSNEWSYSCQQTSDGGYIITGKTYSYDAGLGDFWLIKTDANGNETWNRTFGGTNSECAFSVQQTTDSGYIITGYTMSYGAGEVDIWIIKTDANGNEQWNKTFGGTKDDWGRSGEQTTDGGYIITGWASSYVKGGSNVWLIKTDANGNETWNKTIDSNGRGDRAHSGQQTTDGGYIITGVTWPYGTGGSNVWLIKTDANGNEQWNRKFGGSKDDWGYSGRQTTDGGYIITGMLRSWVPGYGAGWLIKTDANGNETWNKTLDGCGFSVQQTMDSGYILTGYAYPYGADAPDVWLLKVARENQPPIADAGGPYFANVGEEITFNASGSYDPNGEIVSYEWIFGDWTNASGMIVNHTYINPGYYTVILTVIDNDGAISNDTTYALVNSPPDSPMIIGENDGKVGIEYEYLFYSTDVENDGVFYFIEWGDGDIVEWIGPFYDIIPAILYHTWNESGTFIIKAKAKDTQGAESDWAEFVVTMPKDKSTNNMLLLRILERFPLLQRLIQQLSFGL